MYFLYCFLWIQDIFKLDWVLEKLMFKLQVRKTRLQNCNDFVQTYENMISVFLVTKTVSLETDGSTSFVTNKLANW